MADNKVSPQVAAANVGGAWSAGSGVLSSALNLFGAYQQHKWQQEAYDRQLADNLAQWKRENEYDSPKNQIARMRQAGLNPDLMYGDVSPTGASIGKSMPSFQQFENPMAGSASILQMTGAQIANIMADSRLKEAQANNLDASSGELLARTQKTLQETLPHDLYVRMAESGAFKTEAEAQQVIRMTEKIGEDIRLLGEQIKGVNLDNALKDLERLTAEELRPIRVELEKNKLKMSDEEIKYYAKLVLSEVARNNAQARDFNASGQLKEGKHNALSQTYANGYTGYENEVLKSVLTNLEGSPSAIIDKAISNAMESGNGLLQAVALFFYYLTHNVVFGNGGLKVQ